MKWKTQMDVRVLFLILATILVGQLLIVNAQSQPAGATIQYTATRSVSVHQTYDLQSPLQRELQAGEIVTLQLPYIQEDFLVWARLVGTSNFVAVGRMGNCVIESFGLYEPSQLAPVSGG